MAIVDNLLAGLYWVALIVAIAHAYDIYLRHKYTLHPQSNTLALLLASWIVLAGTYLAYLHMNHFGSIPLLWVAVNFTFLSSIRRYHRHSTERIMIFAAIGIIAGAASLAAGWLPELLNPGYNLARYSGLPVTLLVSFVMLITSLKMLFPDIRNKDPFKALNSPKDEGHKGTGDGEMQFASVLALFRGSGKPE